MDVNETQSILLRMYKDIRSVLDRNGIKFYVQYGTAIGALRHDGFIPWDDDIDLLIWYEDMEKVNDVLSKELDPSLYYYHIPTADNHPHVVWKGDDLEASLRDKTAPFIDLFPIEPYPEGRIRRAFANLFILGNVGCIWAIDHISSHAVHRMLSWSPEFFRRMEHRVAGRTSKTVVFCTDWKTGIFPADSYDEASMHVFEDTDVPLPKDIDMMLTSLFGDYMTPPPEDKRTGALGFPCSILKDWEMRDRR